MHKINIIFLLVLFSFNSFSQKIKFKHLTIESGLSQSTVNSIFQDSDGYIWFGTQDGLNKYDGYNFTVYRKNPN